MHCRREYVVCQATHSVTGARPVLWKLIRKLKMQITYAAPGVFLISKWYFKWWCTITRKCWCACVTAGGGRTQVSQSLASGLDWVTRVAGVERGVAYADDHSSACCVHLPMPGNPSLTCPEGQPVVPPAKWDGCQRITAVVMMSGALSGAGRPAT